MKFSLRFLLLGFCLLLIPYRIQALGNFTPMYYSAKQNLVIWGEESEKGSVLTVSDLKGELIWKTDLNINLFGHEICYSAFDSETGLFVFSHQTTQPAPLVNGKPVSSGISVLDIRQKKVIYQTSETELPNSAEYYSLSFYPKYGTVVFEVGNTRNQNGVHVLNYRTGVISELKYGKFMFRFEDFFVYRYRGDENENVLLKYDLKTGDKDVKVKSFGDYNFFNMQVRKPGGIMLAHENNGEYFIISRIEKDNAITERYFKWNIKKGLLEEIPAFPGGTVSTDYVYLPISRNPELFDLLAVYLKYNKDIIVKMRSNDSEGTQLTRFLFALEKKGEDCRKAEMNFFKVLDELQPFSVTVADKIACNYFHLKWFSRDYFPLVKYFSKDFVKWIQETPIEKIGQSGLKTNNDRIFFLKKLEANYSYYTKSLTESHLVTSDQLKTAIEKMSPLAFEEYYLKIKDLVYLGETSFQSAGRDVEKSKRCFRRAMELEPLNPSHPLRLAEITEWQGRDEEADLLYDKALQINPEYSHAVLGKFNMRVNAYFKKGKNISEQSAKEIVTLGERFLQIAPLSENDNRLHVRIMSSFFALYLHDKTLFEKFTQAQKAKSDKIQKFQELQPGIASTGIKDLIAATHYIVAEEYMKTGLSKSDTSFFRKSDAELQQALLNGLDFVPLHVLRYKIHFDYLGNHQEALNIIEPLRKKYPSDSALMDLDARANFVKGEKLVAESKYAEAIPVLEKYQKLRAKPAIRSYHLIGYSYLKVKKNQKATENFEKIISIVGDSSVVRSYFPNLNELLAYSKKPEGNIPEAMDRSVKIEEQEMFFNAAVSDFEKGKKEDAIKRMKEINAYFKSVQYRNGIWVSTRSLALALLRMEKADDALTAFNECLLLEPGSVEIKSHVAKCYVLKGEFDRSLEILNELYKAVPGDVLVRSAYSFYWMIKAYDANKKMEYENAVELFEKAIELMPDDALLHLGLGLSAESTVKYKHKAVPALEKALRLKPSLEMEFPEIRSIIAVEGGIAEESPESSTCSVSYSQTACYGGNVCGMIVVVDGQKWEYRFNAKRSVGLAYVVDKALNGCLLGDMEAQGFTRAH